MDGELLADQPLWQKLIKKWFWLYFFVLIIGPLGYFIKLIVSNRLSVEDVWIFYSVLWLLTLLSSYNDLWLTEALQYFVPKYRIEKKYNNYKTIIIFTFIAQLISGALIWWLLYFWAWRLAASHFHSDIAESIIKIMSVYFLIVNFIQAISSVFYAFQNTLYQWLTEFVRIFSIFIFTIIYRANHTLTISNFACFRVIWFGLAISLWIILFFYKYWYTLKLWKFERKRDLIKKQIRYALWTFLWANIWTLFSQVDQQMIVNILWGASAWYYTIYISMIGGISLITLPILNILFPITTELIAKKDNIKLQILQNIIYKYFSLFALIMSGFFIVFGKEIATVLFTNKFLFSGELVIYSAPLIIFNILYAINFGFMAGMWKVKERVKVLGLALAVNIILNILFLIVLKIWLVWAVFAMWISWLILWIFSYRIVNRNLKISFDWKFLSKNVFVIIMLCLIFWLTKWNYRINGESYPDRLSNVVYILVSWIIFTVIIAGFNYKNIWLLWNEIKNIRK